MDTNDFPLFSPPGWPEDTIGFFSEKGEPLACIKGISSEDTKPISVFESVHDGFRQHLDRTARPQQEVKIDYIPIDRDNFHVRLKPIEDEIRERIARRHDKKVLDAIGISTTQQQPSEPLTIDKLMADIDSMYAKKLEMDKTLIRALVEAGIDIKVSDTSGRPTCTFPKNMARAVAEVRKELQTTPLGSVFDTFTKGMILS
jgi:hypothetical protein